MVDDNKQPKNPEPEQKDPMAKDLKEEDNMNKEAVLSQGTVIVKDRIKAWKTFNAKTSNLGLVREAIKPKVLKEKEGELQMEELIDPALVIINDKSREFGIDLLNNAKNSMFDSFRSIKWIFHELEDLKRRVRNVDNQSSHNDQGTHVNYATNFQEADQRLNNLEDTNRGILQVLEAINDNLSSLKATFNTKPMEIVEARNDKDSQDTIQEDKECAKEDAENLMSIKEVVEAIQNLDKVTVQALLWLCLFLFSGFVFGFGLWPFLWPVLFCGFFPFDV